MAEDNEDTCEDKLLQGENTTCSNVVLKPGGDLNIHGSLHFTLNLTPSAPTVAPTPPATVPVEQPQEAVKITIATTPTGSPLTFLQQITWTFWLVVIICVLLLSIIPIAIYYGVVQNRSGTNASSSMSLNATEGSVQNFSNQTDILPSFNSQYGAKVPNKDLIDKLTTDLDNVRKNLTEIVESDCGGIIKIPITKTSYLLYYKVNKNYSPNENCLWTVDNTENSIRRLLTVRVELISHGFKGNAGLFAFKWNRDGGLASEEITIGAEHELSGEGLYLSFTSDEMLTGGTGFLLRITISHSEQKTHGSNFFYGNYSGSQAVFSHYNSDQISITVNPKNSVIFNIDKVTSKENIDLFVYEIQALGAFEEKGRLSGKPSSSLSFRSAYPILTVFVSDHAETRRRFEISWTES